MSELGVRDVCDMLRDAVKFIEIAQKEERITVLTARLHKLQSQPDPNPEQIAEIKADIQALEAQLKSDRSQLTAFKEEVQAHCPPK
jgi:capsule polysaccharide export protein KpsE/RkpR